MTVRRKSKALVTTYITPKSLKQKLRYGARIVDGRTREEVRCTGPTPAEAARCARERLTGK